MPCPLASNPPACFAKYQESFLQHRNRHSWESIGECQGCKVARVNAEIARVPEPDSDLEARHFFPIPDPKDFEDKPEEGWKVGSGRKKRDACSNGHPYSKYATKRKDGGWRCRKCVSIKKAEAYARKKAAA